MDNCGTDRKGSYRIGQPIHFVTGEFAGHTIRTELQEVQKANLGRKYARVDRRPLDPPPCVWLRIFKIINPGTDQLTEVEIENYGDIRNLGILCHVDLFPVPDEHQHEPLSAGPSRAVPLYTTTQMGHRVSRNEYRQRRSEPAHISPAHYLPPIQTLNESVSPAPAYSPSSSRPPDIVWHHNGHPIRESSKMTSALVGGTCVEASRVNYKGNEVFMFVFGDLAAGVEGTFLLRYRAFDIFSRSSDRHHDVAIQSECYGGSFRVYSTKDFPGLQPSTELSKNIARWGVRINIRERARRRRRLEHRVPERDEEQFDEADTVAWI